MSASQVDDDLITDYDGMYSVASSEYNGGGTRPPAGLVPGPGLTICWGAYSTTRYRRAEMASNTPGGAHIATLTGISGSGVREETTLPCVSAKEGTYESRGNSRYWGGCR
jgi:hypothetical protein